VNSLLVDKKRGFFLLNNFMSAEEENPIKKGINKLLHFLLMFAVFFMKQ